MAAEKILQGLSEDFLQCSICMSRYQNPLMLTCLHSFCSSCLDKWETTTGQQVLSCPTCRRRVELPKSGIKGLPSNFLLTSLMERLDLMGKISEKKAAACDFCRNMTSVLFCMDCQLHLCSTCQVGHSRIPGASEHAVVTSDKVSDVEYLKEMTSKKPPSCSDHVPEKLKFYCTTCSKLICRDCTILSHRGHECCQAEQMVTKAKDSLERHLNESRNLLENLQHEKKKVSDLIRLVETHTTTLQKHVDDEYEKYIKRLESRRTALHQELENLKGEKSEKLTETLTLFNDWLKANNHTTKMTEKVLEGENQWEILGNAVDLIKSFGNLKGEQATLFQQCKNIEAESKNFAELKFIPSAASVGTTSSTFFGKVSRNGSSSLFHQPSGFSFGSAQPPAHHQIGVMGLGLPLK